VIAAAVVVAVLLLWVFFGRLLEPPVSPRPYTHDDLVRDLHGDLPIDDILARCGGRFPEPE
jgi:hypothetical protein